MDDLSEAGRNPVEELAEEFIERRRRGETPTLEEYARKFPHLAEEIRSLFPALVMMEKLGADTVGTEMFNEPALVPSSVGRARSGGPLEHLGDFRILREVGRGGMGVVYEAEQESLGRRVALKVLGGHHTLDRGQVRRFEREARSAARLHHTNIVPVFGVGEQDGLHYYVMQFIQGQGLDEVLAELKRLRTVGAGQLTTGTTPTVDQAFEHGVGQAFQPDGVGQAFEADSQAGNLDVRSQAGKRDLRVAESLLSGEFRQGELRQASQAGGGIDVSHGAAERPMIRSGYPPTRCAGTPGSAERENEDSSVTLPGQSELSSAGKSGFQYARSVARIGIQVAGALEYANAQGILHRDIKPSNLLLDLKGTAWVTDFGLAKASDGDDLTHTGDIVGTLRYMAPERFRGRCDARADIYSLGLTLYELLALRPAFDESDRQQLIEQVTQQEPARLRKLNPAVPRDLATIVHKAMARDPGDRYPTAAALAEDLERLVDDKPIRARQASPVERLLRWGRRNPGLAGLTAAVLLLLVAVAVVSSVSAVWLGRSLRDTQAAQADATDKLWGSYLAQARAGRLTRQPGQRFASLRVIQEALKLPLPPGRSLDELRTEAIACLCLPDLEVAREWDGCPTGTSAWAIDDDFERYARGDDEGNVSVRRVADDRELFGLPGEGIPLWEYGGLEFSPDGRFLHLLWNGPQGLRGRLWRIDSAPPVAVLDDEHVNLAFRPDSGRFATSYRDGAIQIWDSETLRELRRFSGGLSRARLRWNPRFPQLAIVEPRGICRVLDLDSGDTVSELSAPGGCDWIDWHPAGRIVAISSFDAKIYLYEVATRRLVVPPLEGHKSVSIVIRFDHAGDRLVSNDWSNLLRLWDVPTGRQLLSQPARGPFLSFSRDDRLLAADVDFPRIRLFDFCTGSEFRTVVHRSTVGNHIYNGNAIAARGADGRLVALSAADGVALVDLARGEEVATLPDNQPLCFESNDAALWTCGTRGVLRWPLHTGAADARRYVGPPQAMGSYGNTCAWGASADTETLCLPNFDAGALLWLRSTNATISLGPQDDVRGAAVSPNGKWVATASHRLKRGAGAKVWDGATGQHVTDLPAGAFCCVRFSPDGRWLVTTGGAPRIWEVGAWREGPKLGGSGANIGEVRFTADSKLLALEDGLGIVRLVRTETGEELARLTAPEPTRLQPQAFSPDGAQLVTQGVETRALHIFDLRAIRAQLSELDLDWDAPSFPSAPESAAEPPGVQFERTNVYVEPLDVQVDLGNLHERVRSDELVGRAAEFKANKQFTKALEALREAVRVDPTHAEAHNSLAWLLLTGPAEFRDPNEALPLALKALELAPDLATYKNTLGVAHYRAGELSEAIGALESSLSRSRGETDAFDLFFLAMCQHRLGDAAKAADCRDRADRWFAQHRETMAASWVEELTEFQAEAAGVLAQPPGEPGR